MTTTVLGSQISAPLDEEPLEKPVEQPDSVNKFVPTDKPEKNDITFPLPARQVIPSETVETAKISPNLVLHSSKVSGSVTAESLQERGGMCQMMADLTHRHA